MAIYKVGEYGAIIYHASQKLVSINAKPVLGTYQNDLKNKI